MTRDFSRSARKVLARRPTGSDIDLDEAFRYHRAPPERRRGRISAEAHAAGRTRSQALARCHMLYIQEQIRTLQHIETHGGGRRQRRRRKRTPIQGSCASTSRPAPSMKSRAANRRHLRRAVVAYGVEGGPQAGSRPSTRRRAHAWPRPMRAWRRRSSLLLDTRNVFPWGRSRTWPTRRTRRSSRSSRTTNTRIA